MYADIEIEGKPRYLLACPKSAIHDCSGKKVVFVNKESGFEARPVKLGIDNELYSEVLSGLVEGDEVATQGSLMLKAELGNRH
jgi:cobalt-zinc-cadmium efflux system membrane fusion protein